MTCSDEYRSRLTHVNSLLVAKQFDACLQQSQSSTTALLASTSDARVDSNLEAFVCVALQAYAELGRWQEALPYVTQVYNGIEECPARIAQLCLLLHAYMRDYTTCAAVTHIWLRNETNRDRSQSSELVRIYLDRVLVPQRKWQEAHTFLDNCQVLPAEQTAKLKSDLETAQKHVEEKREAERISLQGAPDSTKSSDGVVGMWDRMMSVLTGKWATKASRLIVFLTALHWIVSRYNPDYMPQLKAVYQFLVRLWKKMFAPFHLSR